jgi:hypothetical protein
VGLLNVIFLEKEKGEEEMGEIEDATVVKKFLSGINGIVSFFQSKQEGTKSQMNVHKGMIIPAV